MKIIITKATPLKVTVNGQELNRSFAEEVLLPLCVNAQGDNDAAIVNVAKAFDGAGLNLLGSPKAVRLFTQFKIQEHESNTRREAEAQAHAERCAQPTREEIAKKQAEREDKAAAIRAHGQQMRATRGR